MAITALIRPFNKPRPRSSWVDKVAFGEIDGQDEPGVIIKFLDREDQFGAIHYGPFCFYPQTTEQDYEEMIGAKSWGRQVWDKFYYRDYVIV